MLGVVIWDAVAAAVTGQRSWLPRLAAVLLGIGLMMVMGGNAAASRAPLFALVGDRIWWPADPTRPEGSRP
jgi:hypothetical protein